MESVGNPICHCMLNAIPMFQGWAWLWYANVLLCAFTGSGRQGELPYDKAGQDRGHDLHACSAEAAGVPGAGLQI